MTTVSDEPNLTTQSILRTFDARVDSFAKSIPGFDACVKSSSALRSTCIELLKNTHWDALNKSDQRDVIRFGGLTNTPVPRHFEELIDPHFGNETERWKRYSLAREAAEALYRARSGGSVQWHS